MFTKIAESGLDRIGGWNPQLMREWQGRLRWRNVLLTLLISFAVQILLVVQYLVKLPQNDYRSSGMQYCLEQIQTSEAKLMTCKLGADGYPLINWPFVWADVFRDVSLVLVWVLLIGGMYLLVADLSKEMRRGTLNFLRMSPQPSRQILLGKLMGVPVLLYLGLAAMLPLHLSMGLMATYPLMLLLAFYGLLGAIAFCFYTAALWFGLLTPGLQGFQPWLIAGTGLGLLAVGFSGYRDGSSLDWARLFEPIQLLSYWEVKGPGIQMTWPFHHGFDQQGFRYLGWFLQPIGAHSGTYLLFALANALILGAWFWVVLERRFETPGRTPLGKVQSYGLTLCLSLIVMGFNVQSAPTEVDQWKGQSFSDFLWSYPISMLICAIVLMFLLLPSQQAVLDWSRYRHQYTAASNQSRQHRHRLLRDLLSHDASPGGLAVAVNLGVMTGVLLLGIAVTPWYSPTAGAAELLLRWGFCAAFLLSCALVIQWISLSNVIHWRWLAFGSVATLVLGWPIVLSMLGASLYDGPSRYLWLVTAFPQSLPHAAWSGIGLAIAAHLTILTTLITILTRRVQGLGQSEWKALTAAQGG